MTAFFSKSAASRGTAALCLALMGCLLLGVTPAHGQTRAQGGDGAWFAAVSAFLIKILAEYLLLLLPATWYESYFAGSCGFRDTIASNLFIGEALQLVGPPCNGTASCTMTCTSVAAILILWPVVNKRRLASRLAYAHAFSTLSVLVCSCHLHTRASHPCLTECVLYMDVQLPGPTVCWRGAPSRMVLWTLAGEPPCINLMCMTYSWLHRGKRLSHQGLKLISV
jgi:hypothetical protein